MCGHNQYKQPVGERAIGYRTQRGIVRRKIKALHLQRVDGGPVIQGETAWIQETSSRSRAKNGNRSLHICSHSQSKNHIGRHLPPLSAGDTTTPLSSVLTRVPLPALNTSEVRSLFRHHFDTHNAVRRPP